jgi:Kef-type K+ transport system membrane component KefB
VPEGWLYAIGDCNGRAPILALFGLAFLLLLAGLEIDLARLRGPRLRLALLGYAITLG